MDIEIPINNLTKKSTNDLPDNPALLKEIIKDQQLKYQALKNEHQKVQNKYSEVQNRYLEIEESYKSDIKSYSDKISKLETRLQECRANFA